MWKNKLPQGIAWPTILVSLVLLGLCTATAVFLYRQQADLSYILEEAVGSRRVASELETPIKGMIALLKEGNTQVEDLEGQFRNRLREAQKFANTEVEIQLVGELDESIANFHTLLAVPAAGKSGKNDSIRSALHLLEHTLSLCHRLRDFNQMEIGRSEAQLRENLKWMAWGLVAIGIIASCGGIFLGYGVARALRHSIHQLSVRIRDAADKLGQELPTVTLTSGRNMDHLHEQIQSLVPQIEQVVDRLQQREREVLRAEQLSAVGQLAAGVAHELRNPLTAIKLLIQSSREEMTHQGLPAEDLQTIELEIRRLEKCLQTFLDFARPPKMECHTMNLVQVIDQALALVGGRARKQRVEVQFRTPPGPVLIQADGEQLRQVLVNLFLNSLDVMPKGGLLEIDLSLDQKGQIELRVLDSGSGIAAEVLPRLFEPFVSGKETGLGLGLVVSRRIAEAHGGRLWGTNRPAGGACFVLRLPLPAPVGAHSHLPQREPVA